MSNTMALRINRKLYYGWIILFVSAISYFFSSPGQTYSISVFIDSYIYDFGYSRTLISSIYAFATIASGLSMIFVGRAVDHFGSRRMLVFTGLFLALACFFNSIIQTIPMIFFGFFLLRFFGQGSLTLIPGSLVPQWFEQRRAFAISILSLGTILGNLIVPYVNHTLISSVGWQNTWIIWGVGLILIYLPIAKTFVINKPEDIHLLPDNVKARSHTHLAENIKQLEKESFQLNEAIKTKEFWFIGIISMILPMLSTGMMFHFYSIMSTKGIDDSATSIIIGLVALPGFIMPIVAGTVIDRYKPKHILGIALLIVAFDLLFMNLVFSVFTAILFIVFYGFSNSIVGVTLNVIWANYFGRLHLGSIRGAATVFTVIGSAFGTVPFGLSYDLSGSYTAVFSIMSMFTFIGVVLTLFIKKPEKAI